MSPAAHNRGAVRENSFGEARSRDPLVHAGVESAWTRLHHALVSACDEIARRPSHPPPQFDESIRAFAAEARETQISAERMVSILKECLDDAGVWKSAGAWRRLLLERALHLALDEYFQEG